MKSIFARLGNGSAVSGALVLLLLAFSAGAATKTWSNSSGGNWNSGGNWSPAGVPAPGDTALINLAGTYTVVMDVSPALGSLTLGGAGSSPTLDIETQTLTVTNGIVASGAQVTMNGGTLSGSVVIDAGGTLALASAAQKVLYALVLVNNGTVQWSGGTLYGGSFGGTTVTNAGLWVCSSDDYFLLGNGNGPVAFYNLAPGTVRKTAASGSSLFNSLTFANAGLIDVQRWTITLGTQVNSVLGGLVTTAAGAGFNLNGGTYTGAGAVFTGGGLSQQSGGTLALPADRLSGLSLTGGTVVLGSGFQQNGAITNLTVDGGTLTGTNRVAAGGTLTVNAGSLAGVLTVDAGGTLALASAAQKVLYALVLVNNGTVQWSGGTLYGGSFGGTTVTNAGLWVCSSDDYFLLGNGNGPVAFYNLAPGTVRKTAASGSSLFNSLTFANAGLIDVQRGTITLPTGFTNQVGTLNTRQGASLTSGDRITLGSGLLQGSGTVQLKSADGGTIEPGEAGPGRLTFATGLNLTSGATVSMKVLGLDPGTNYDQIKVIGAVNLNGATLALPGITGLPIGAEIILIDNDGTDPVAGTFAGHPNGALFTAGMQLFRLWYDRGTGNDVVLIRDSGGAVLSKASFAGGQFPFQGRGTNSATYTIYAATNLVDPVNWTVIGSAVADPSGLFQFTDTNAFLYPMRFYKSLGP